MRDKYYHLAKTQGHHDLNKTQKRKAPASVWCMMTYPSCPLDGPITLIIDENKADDHLNFLDDKCEYDTDVLREIGQNTKDEFGQRIIESGNAVLKEK